MTQTITLTAADYAEADAPARDCNSGGSAILLAGLACVVLFWAPLIVAMSVLL